MAIGLAPPAVKLKGGHDEWRECDISDLCLLQRGFDLTEATRKHGTVPVYSSSGLAYFHCEAKLQPPSVITGRKGQLGRVYFVEEPCWPHDTTLWVKDFKGNDPRFISIFLGAFRLERFDAATSVPTLNRNNLVGHAIRIPPLQEQRVIAAALGDIDALLAGLDRLIAKKRDLKQAAMQQLLTGQTRLPGFQGEWEVTRLGDVLKFQVGFPFGSADFNDKGQGVRLVKNRDLKSDDQEFHYSGTCDPSFQVRNDDVLVGMDGDFLPCRWTKGPALLNQRVGRIVPLTGLDRTFAFYYLIAPLKEIEIATASTTVKHLSHGDIESIEKPLPKVPEQTAIATVLSDMDAELTALEARRDKIRALKQGMMQELLTGRTRLV